MAEETKAAEQKAHKAEVAPEAKAPAGMPAVITLDSMKAAYPEQGEEAFYQIGIAGGFGDFRKGNHPDPALELASLTGSHKTAVAEIFAGLKK